MAETEPRSLRVALLALGVAALLCGCPPGGMKRKSPAKRPGKPGARPPAAAAPAGPKVDAAGQKRAYDRGLALFGEEKYQGAAQAWDEAVRLGPQTPVGRKAKENLDKVRSMLKTLKELEGQ